MTTMMPLWSSLRKQGVSRNHDGNGQRQRHKTEPWLLEWRKIVVLHAFWCYFSAKRPHEMFKFEQRNNRKSCILCLCENRSFNQVKGHFAYFLQCDPHGIITKHFTCCELLFWSDVFVAAAFVASLTPWHPDTAGKGSCKTWKVVFLLFLVWLSNV